ncbi:MAG: glycerophosphodiester phosphodiesterase family protein [Alphaproteobacteria bacterium]|nr:glycerophosphodiester phosphodiesterase family protein [Alphaproteobacteria bacterium]MDP6516455.1 glycerophosphodiester phosphodiesterase family protein [Alphaproteobacteria bacterium]
MIAHRGASAIAPENTLAAFRAAAQQGADGFEFDVRLTSDRACVVVHDARLDRTTNGVGPVAGTSGRAVADLDAGTWFGPRFAGEGVPTLALAASSAIRHGLRIIVEIKAEAGAGVRAGIAVARQIGRIWPRDLPLPLLSSFDPESLVAAARACPAAPRALVAQTLPADWRRLEARLGLAAINLDERAVTRRVANALDGAGLVIGAYTVDDPARARWLRRLGVALIITNHPLPIRRALGTLPSAGGRGTAIRAGFLWKRCHIPDVGRNQPPP